MTQLQETTVISLVLLLIVVLSLAIFRYRQALKQTFQGSLVQRLVLAMRYLIFLGLVVWPCVHILPTVFSNHAFDGLAGLFTLGAYVVVTAPVSIPVFFLNPRLFKRRN